MSEIYYLNNQGIEKLNNQETIEEKFKQTNVSDSAVCHPLESAHIAIVPTIQTLEQSLHEESSAYLSHRYVYCAPTKGWLYVFDDTHGYTYEYEITKPAYFTLRDRYSNNGKKNLSKSNWDVKVVKGVIVSDYNIAKENPKYSNMTDEQKDAFMENRHKEREKQHQAKVKIAESISIIKTQKGDTLPYIRCLTHSVIQLFFSHYRLSDKDLREHPSLWPQSIHLKNYATYGSIPELDISTIFMDDGIYDEAQSLKNNISSSGVENSRLKLKELISKLKEINSSPFTSNSISKIINTLTKELAPPPNDPFNRVKHFTWSVSEYYSLDNILDTKQHRILKCLDSIISLNSSPYTDGTAPLKDITDSSSYRIDKATINDILTQIKTDDSVNKNSLNMLAYRINDPLGTIDTLLTDLNNYSKDIKNINKKSIIAETCFNILYPKNAKDIINKIPYSYYRNLKTDQLICLDDKSCRIVNTDGLLKELKDFENIHYNYYMLEYDLLHYLSYVNDSTYKDFSKEIGIDYTDINQYCFLAESLSHVFTLCSITQNGISWLEEELVNPKSVGLLLFGFNPKLYEESKKVDINKAVFDIAKVFKSLIEEKYSETLIMLQGLCTKNNKFKDLFTHIGICIITTLANSQIKNHSILIQGIMLETVNNLKIKRNPNYKKLLEIWEAKNSKVRQYKGIEKSLNIDKHIGASKEIMDKKRAQLKKLHKKLEPEYEKFEQRFGFIAVEEEIKSPKSHKPSPTEASYNSKSIVPIKAIINAIFIITDLKLTINQLLSNDSSNLEKKIALTSLINTANDIVIKWLEHIDAKYYQNNSNLGLIGVNAKQAIKQQIGVLTKANAIISVGLSFLSLYQSALDFTKSTTNNQKIANSILVAMASVSSAFALAEMLSIISTSSTLGAPGLIIGIIVAAITFIAGIISARTHRTDIQTWLEHCSYGNKNSTPIIAIGETTKSDKWKWATEKEQLFVLKKIMMTPVISVTQTIKSTGRVDKHPRYGTTHHRDVILSKIDIKVELPYIDKHCFVIIDFFSSHNSSIIEDVIDIFSSDQELSNGPKGISFSTPKWSTNNTLQLDVSLYISRVFSNQDLKMSIYISNPNSLKEDITVKDDTSLYIGNLGNFKYYQDDLINKSVDYEYNTIIADYAHNILNKPEENYQSSPLKGMQNIKTIYNYSN